MTKQLSIRDLTITTPAGARLIDGVNLDLSAGERLALVGESGSGKTVLARAIMRLTPELMVDGSIRFGADELTAMSDREMAAVRGRRIAMVFQDPLDCLNPLMTIGAQIAESIRVAGVRKQTAYARAVRLLTELGVSDADRRLGAYPHEFSGGMRQRVAIAIALINEPELLIADEPTTALDVRVQQQVLDLLDEVVTERGLGLLIITHDLGVVASLADRVAVMYSGRIAEVDVVDPLFAAPAHPYTSALLEAVPRLDVPDQVLQPIPGSPPAPARRPSGCAFHPRCGRATDMCATQIPDPTALPTGGVVSCHHPSTTTTTTTTSTSTRGHLS